MNSCFGGLDVNRNLPEAENTCLLYLPRKTGIAFAQTDFISLPRITWNTKREMIFAKKTREMPYKSYLILLVCVAIFVACKPVKWVQYHPPLAAQVVVKPVQHDKNNRIQYVGADNWADYLPDTAHLGLMPMRYIRLNIHIMNRADSNAITGTQAHGEAIARALLDAANIDLDTNIRNWQSPDGTEVLPRRMKYVLWPQTNDNGIYFHYDDDHYYYVVTGRNQNNYSRTVIDKYGIGLDTIVNVFIQVHHPDSLVSKTYKASGQAIALGTDVKLSGVFELGKPPHDFRGMFNHEIGHVFSLAHAWSGDGCPDTDDHPNRCYMWHHEGPCSELASNNMMDYNAYEIAVTPCQIGKMQHAMANERSHARSILVPTWCVKSQPDVIIRDHLTLSGQRDLESDIVIEKGGVLTLKSRLSMPAQSKILVKPGGILRLDGCRLHNACDKDWQGIILEKGRTGAGRVEVIKEFTIENTIKN
jgi:hypothetical protein